MILRISLAIVLAYLIFHNFPEIDIAVTRFISETTGFWGGGWLKSLRNFYFEGSFWLLYFIIFLYLAALLQKGEVAARIYGFFVALVVMGPILLVNVVLKAHWGRARPDETTLFGGDKEFTPVSIFPVDQCARDCSFVSGEGAAAAAMIFAFTLMFGRSRRAKLVVWALFLPMAIMRIGFGKHFLSDTIFAFLFVWLIGQILLVGFQMKPKDLLLPRGAFARDMLSAPRRFFQGMLHHFKNMLAPFR